MMKKRRKPSRRKGHSGQDAGIKKGGRDRDTAPRELGAVIKQGKHLLKVALVYPNTYRAGMSSLGFQTVYRLANQIPEVRCERVFLPGPGQAGPDRGKSGGRALGRTAGKAPNNGGTSNNGKTVGIKSVETGLRLDQFDIILFSISFENDYIHLVRLLRETGIPLRSPDRNHIHPLVAAGGVACFLNPEPIAPFMDLFLLGEAELLLAPFFERYRATADRPALLAGIEAALPGAYVPARHNPILYHSPSGPPPIGSKISLQYQPSLDGVTPIEDRIPVQYQPSLEGVTTHTCILTSETAFKDIYLLETLKGCPHGCRFCTAGFIYRPPRTYPLANLTAAMDEAAAKTGRLGLVSSAVLDHPDIETICRYGRDKGLTLSFSSLRADRLDDEIIQMLSQSGVKTATIAPEAGSDRMRRIINKKLDQEAILAAAQKLVEHNIPNLRLYFMIGLPFETDDDVHAIVELAHSVKATFLEASRKQGRIGTITLSINPFIPKPCTPFQWAGMAAELLLKHRADIIRQGLKTTANVTVNVESLKKSRINALLSLGDRRTADLLESAAQNGWPRTMKENQAYCHTVIHREKPVPLPGEPCPALPWQFLAHPISDTFLAKEWRRAKTGKQSPSCPMKDCRDCRICIRS